MILSKNIYMKHLERFIFCFEAKVWPYKENYVDFDF